MTPTPPPPWTAARQASLSFSISQSRLKFMSNESVMISNHLLLCCSPLLLPSIFPNIRVFSSESALRIRWPKYWNFSFSIRPSNEYSGLISFMIGWLDLPAVQGTLKSLLQHHSSKSSISWHSAFFMANIYCVIFNMWFNMLYIREFICIASFNANNYPYLVNIIRRHSSTLAWKIPWMEEPGGL